MLKRRVLNFYARHVPERVKEAVPPGFVANMAGLIFRWYPHPDLAFQHARHLTRQGKGAEAARLYSDVLSPGLTGSPADSGPLNDPLFDCRSSLLAPDPLFSDKVLKSGCFHVEYSYSGLKVLGKISVKAGDPVAERLDLLLDDVVLRSDRLSYAAGSADYLFPIRRQTLDSFPKTGVLRLRTSQGHYLGASTGSTGVVLHIPHGDGTLSQKLALTGRLDKKGFLRLGAGQIKARQDGYLALYSRARAVFRAEFGKPLIILCGTLLGQTRDGDFIPEDDDFDVGYVSEHTRPEAVKAEAVDMIERLVARGFTVQINREGKPFRLSDDQSGVSLHLDSTPIFSRNDGHVWLHKLARLPIGLNGLRQTRTALMRDTEVDIPAEAEAFLAAYYGPDWRVPDPSFSYSGRIIPAAVRQGLKATCLTQSEQRALMRRLTGKRGDFRPMALQKLYPASGIDG